MHGASEAVSIRVQSVALDSDRSDERLGEQLVALVRRSLARGDAPSSAVAVASSRADIVPLQPLAESGLSLPPVIAGLASALPDGTQPVDSIGLIGTFQMNRSDLAAPVHLAMVFLEWSDCRWWHWRALVEVVDGRVRIRPETETVDRAVDGAARPEGLGGWWSLARRTGVQMRFIPELPVSSATADLVH